MGVVQNTYYSSIGATELNNSEFVYVTPLEVKRQGLGYDIILTGTPGNRQVLYTASEGKFTFSIPFEAGDSSGILIRGLSEPIHVVYKQ